MAENNTAHENTCESRRNVLKATAVGTMGALAGCLGDDGADEDVLRVGVFGPLTGPNANIGEAKQMGWEVIANDINENGGIDGAEIELVTADSESEPTTGRSDVNRIMGDIDILGGGYHSDVCLAVSELAHAEQMPYIIDEGVSEEINNLIIEEDMTTVFKTAPPSEAYAAAWGDLVADFDEAEVGHFPFEDQTIAMIAEDTSYGISVMDATEEYVEEEGWEVVSKNDVPLEETDFTSLLASIQADEPDIVWAVQTNSAGTGALMDQYQEVDFGESHFFHNFGLTAGDARDTAGDSANGAFTIVHPDAVPEFIGELEWDELWEAETDLDLSGFAATSMTNMAVIAEMVESAGGVSEFREMSPEEWEEHVIAQDPIQGGVGNIDFQENHQADWGSAETIPTLGYQVVDGELNLVWPFEIAEEDIDMSFYN